VVSNHPIFKRQDTSIFSTVPVSFANAALGGTIRIKTVDGEVEYEVRPGTQTDTKVRLKGKGVPSLRNRAIRGDHFVTLVVSVPERMTEAQKEALRKFDEAMTGIGEGDKHKKKGIFK
jgi:molecular chaperone DnaJ